MSDSFIQFSHSGMLCIDALTVERETGPAIYRACYEGHRNGQVSIKYFEVDETRFGHPKIWRRCQMQDEVRRELEHALEDDIKAEQQRMADQLDEEMA